MLFGVTSLDHVESVCASKSWRKVWLGVQAKLHQARSETREAAHYFRMNLERIEAENISGADQLDALMYLAEYAKVSEIQLLHLWLSKLWLRYFNPTDLVFWKSDLAHHSLTDLTGLLDGLSTATSSHPS